MKIRFDSTRLFEESLAQHSTQEREEIIGKINQLASLFMADSSTLEIHRFKKKILGGLDSSLYTARLSTQARLIFTAETDPIFDQAVFTLLALTTPEQYDRDLAKIAASLYPDHLPTEVHGAVMSDAV